MNLTRKYALSFLLLLHVLVSQAQHDSTSTDIYKINYKWEAPVAIAFLGASYFGFRELDKHSSYTATDIARLNVDHINDFDRPVALLNPAGFAHAQKQSDLFLNLAVVSPALLLLDKKVRENWVDFVTLLAITHTVDNALYFGAAFSTRRARPLTYNPNLPLEDKIGDAKSNSFFSGHVSFSATSSFFIAKLYTDYHQVKGWKRMLLYTGAAIPPALVGYYRMKAGKHFKTDVIVGLLVGAASGIGIPELHRYTKKDKNLSLNPFYMQGYSGLSLNYHIR